MATHTNHPDLREHGLADNWAHTRNAEARAICEPRWVGWEYPKSKHDPCGGCPLTQPCIKVTVNAGPEAFNRWIDGINELALRLSNGHA